MAGATNRAMKAAGVPKATIATLRVEHGGHLSLRSAISIAHERGLDTGKAHDFMAKRDAKKAAAPAAQAATADFRSKAAAGLKAGAEKAAAAKAAKPKASFDDRRLAATKKMARMLRDAEEASNEKTAAFRAADAASYANRGSADQVRQTKAAAASAAARVEHLKNRMRSLGLNPEKGYSRSSDLPSVAEHKAKRAAEGAATAAARAKSEADRAKKEDRAAVLVARLRDRAANNLATDRGDRAGLRAMRVLKAHPGALDVAEQLRGERRFETKSAVNQTMRLGSVSRSNFNLPATRSERVAGLLSSMKAKEAQSAARRADMRAAAGAKPFDGAMGKFKAHAQKQIDDYYAANFPNSKTKPTLHYSDGEKYIRVTKVEPGQKTGSAHSFIDKATGDVLKPDGFKRPAKGARGNIFSGDFGVNEHGANYSAAYMKRRGATDFYAAPSKGPSKRERQENADLRAVVMGPKR